QAQPSKLLDKYAILSDDIVITDPTMAEVYSSAFRIISESDSAIFQGCQYSLCALGKIPLMAPYASMSSVQELSFECLIAVL
ncbi:hypothetical protein PanWU01x14_192430, partial [Parasponia andersonii]